MNRLIIISILVLSSLVMTGQTRHQAQSPDGRYVLSLNDDGGVIKYGITNGKLDLISDSQLGIQCGRKYLNGLKIKEFRLNEEKDTCWRPVYGERELIRDHYKSYVVTLCNETDEKKPVPISLEIRLYDEGVAFRYVFNGGNYLKITDEFTEFSVPEGTMAYFTARAQTEHSLLPLKDWPGDGESDRPLLLRLPEGKGYLCLAEAQVFDYVRTKFRLSDKANTITTAMYGPVEDIAPYHTPWRVIMYGEKAGDILQNNSIFYNLNPECKIGDCSWIKPGKVMREVTLSTEGGKALVDFAVKRNIQYIHFDAGWYGPEYEKSSDATTVTLDPGRNPNPDALNLKEVIAYAKSKGIGVLVYVNQRALQQQLDEILPLYKEWGISGIKFGFVQVGSQVWTKWMHEAVAKCAKYGLMVDIHDEYRPTGVSRTYPNLMTQEGVRGNEEFPDGFNNTLLPFTRFVCGPADYTICYYRRDFGRENDAHGVPRSKILKTTPAHQLALSVVYYSPFQFMYWYDKPSDSLDEPELKFFDDVYTVWDDTLVLEGEPGEYATLARRHQKEWFIGAITNHARKTTVDLDFLDKGKYVAEIYSDGDDSIPTRTKVRVKTVKVTSGSQLKLDMKNNGGTAIHIIPAE